MQKAAKLALANTLDMQATVLDMLSNVGEGVKHLFNGHTVEDSVLARHKEQDAERKQVETTDS